MFGLGDMMKKAQEMQAKMAEMQDALKDMTVTGEAGGGLVKVTLNGQGEMVKTEIDPSLLSADEHAVLEDLIVVAHGHAKARVGEQAAEQMKDLTGGLDLPPGMKLPF